MEAKTTKKQGVLILAVVSILLLTATVSASLSNIEEVNVKGIESLTDDVSVLAGETLPITVIFEALENASNVRLEAELVGTKVDVEKEVFVGDLEENKSYIKSLTIDVPYELQDEVSDNLELKLRLWNGDFETTESTMLRVQRQSYNIDIKSINTEDKIRAGNVFPVDIVIKNTGYNNLDDLYVTAKIPELSIVKKAYVGDLSSIENKTIDEEDTTRARMFLRVPYSVSSGTYELQVKISNSDLTVNKVEQVTVENEFPENMIVESSEKTANTGEEVSYRILVVNPTNNIKAYRIVTGDSGDVSVNPSSSVISVPSDSSREVTITAKAASQGKHEFDVNIFSGEELTGKTTLSLNAEEGVSSPVVVLTIILAVIFLVLLGVLIVLITRQPKKQEEFGESYY